MRLLPWLLVLLAFALPALAAPSSEVATMLAMEGPVTWRHADGPWYAAFPEQRNRIEDHVRTGPESVATLEFDLGGRVGLNTDTELVITGAREAEAVDQGVLRTLVLKTGGIWARITGQEKELQVETSGGVMGIKGTEFVVDLEEDGTTSLSVLEGEVEVRPEDGEPVLVRPGFQARFARRVRPRLQQVGTPEQLREKMQGRWKRYLGRFAALLAAAGREKFQGWSGRQVDVVSDPLMLRSRTEGGQRSGRGPRRKVNFAAGLVPDGNTVKGRPAFTWDPVEGARAYVLLLSGAPKQGQLDWMAVVKEPRAVYPENGRPLEPKRYWWRVIPLGPDGKPVGRASQTWFEVSR